MTKLKKDGSKLIRDYEQKVKLLKIDLIKHIQELPDNPRITRIGTDNKAFTMSFKDLGERWSPYYHDFNTISKDSPSFKVGMNCVYTSLNKL